MFGRKLRHRLSLLERQNAALVESLRWYANREHWLRKATNEPGQPRAWTKSQAAHDRGERARQGLAFAHLIANPRPVVTVPPPARADAAQAAAGDMTHFRVRAVAAQDTE